jgi:hypothetical protein
MAIEGKEVLMAMRDKQPSTPKDAVLQGRNPLLTGASPQVYF